MDWLRDDAGRVRTRWRLPIYVVGFFILQVILSCVLLIGLVIYLQVQGEKNFEGWVEEHEAMLNIGAVPFMALATFGWTWLCRRLLDRRSLRSLGFGRPRTGWGTVLILGNLAGVLPVAAAVGITGLLGGIHLLAFRFPPSVLGILAILVVAAFFEEFVCRGYLLRNFMEVGRTGLGVLITSLFFTFLHIMNPAILDNFLVSSVNLFLAGILLSLAYLWSGDLWFPTALHFGWNAAQGPILGVPVSGMNLPSLAVVESDPAAHPWVSGGGFGVEGTLAATLVLLLCIGAFLWLLSRKDPESTGPSAPEDV